jgi:DNA repair exonuclease SbcCD ATPase subunit
MRVKEVNLERFMSATDESVELPDKGIVLIVGKNGSGKSMLIEAVAMAAWGESIRDCTPWVPGRSGAVQIATSYGTITRRADSKHTKTVTWSESPDGSMTASKGQLLLDRVLPPFDTWSKTNTYSSSVLDSFSRATDKERKKLLEDVIRLNKFDDALKRSKEALSTLKVTAARTESGIKSRQDEIGRLDQTLAELSSLKLEGSEEQLAALRAEAIKLSKELDAAKQDYAQQLVKLQDWTTRNATLQQEKISAQAAVKRLSSGECPVCGGPTTEGLQKAQAELQRLTDKLAAFEPRPHLEDAQSDINALSSRFQELKQQGIAMKEALQRNSELSQKLAGIRSRQEQLNSEVLELQASLERDKDEILLEEACVSALGLKGVRSHLLAGALDALESGSNFWLSRFYPENNVKMRIFMDNDKVCLEVTGLAANVGYKGLSEGQKRRVNLALVMALGTLAGYAGGQDGGTIFFDEVLDTLDQEGCETAANVLLELAEENCVVVITHSKELIRCLQPTVTFRVENGKYCAIDKQNALVSESADTAPKRARKKSAD